MHDKNNLICIKANPSRSPVSQCVFTMFNCYIQATWEEKNQTVDPHFTDDDETSADEEADFNDLMFALQTGLRKKRFVLLEHTDL